MIRLKQLVMSSAKVLVMSTKVSAISTEDIVNKSVIFHIKARPVGTYC